MIYNDINFKWKPDWGAGFSIKYGFVTALFSSKQEKEQRTVMRAKPERAVQFSVLEEKTVAQQALNELRTAYRKTIYAPIRSEEFKATDTGATITDGVIYTINIEDVSKYFNLNNFGNDLFIDDVRGLVAPARTTFSALSATSITFGPIVGTFSLAIERARFFPMVPCLLDSIDIPVETDTVIGISLALREKQA